MEGQISLIASMISSHRIYFAKPNLFPKKDSLSSLCNNSTWTLSLFVSVTCELSAKEFRSCNCLSSSFSLLISPIWIDKF